VDAIIGLRGNVPVAQQIVFASRVHLKGLSVFVESR
jgi:hypothetical protein